MIDIVGLASTNKWLDEADELLARNDIVQASEKYYKAVRGNLVKVKDRWKSKLLFEDARKTVYTWANKFIIVLFILSLN